MKASKYSSTEVMQLLVNAGATLELKDDWDKTALMHAVEYICGVRLLLKAGAQVDQTGKKGWTALHYAALLDYIDVAQELLKNGANRTKLTTEGQTPADIARESNNNRLAEIIEGTASGSNFDLSPFFLHFNFLSSVINYYFFNGQNC